MLYFFHRVALAATFGVVVHGQSSVEPDLASAYAVLAQKDYDLAIDSFKKSLAKQPGNASVHKDLAYTLLKTGENIEARDEFEAAFKLSPHDDGAALEYAFLAYETGKAVEARRTFDRLRKSTNGSTRATAEQAFQNIDRPLGESIVRWQQALARSAKPGDLSTFSIHWELAKTAELRDNLPLAAEEYEICRKLKPQLSELLIALARVWRQLNRVEDAKAALLAASRQSNSRTAELGLEQWGTRYPYPYEFVNALAIDPQNIGLRKELAFLYLAMGNQKGAIEQFERLLTLDPNDKPSRDQLDALQGTKSPQAAGTSGADPGVDAKKLGERSLALGYARDAIKYLRLAHDEDPDDAEVMLKLGWAYNYAKDDEDALQWFERARHADNPQIELEATKAFHNLNGDAVAQTTVWALPMYSSRWHDVFTYGQAKHTFPLPWKGMNRWFSLYLSARFIGDLQSSMPHAAAINPQYLSDSSFIFGVGAASKTWKRFTGWVEAGESVKYLPFRHDLGAAIPDYRGGVNFSKGFGNLLGAHTSGPFLETTADAIYISRYDCDWLFNSQNRTGWTFAPWAKNSAQILFNANYLHDLKHQYWAETMELGPGFKIHMPWMRPEFTSQRIYCAGSTQTISTIQDGLTITTFASGFGTPLQNEVPAVSRIGSAWVNTVGLRRSA